MRARAGRRSEPSLSLARDLHTTIVVTWFFVKKGRRVPHSSLICVDSIAVSVADRLVPDLLQLKERRHV